MRRNYYRSTAYVRVVSINVQRLEVGPGNDEYVERAWRLKERIRNEDGVLRQRKHFFTTAYRRSTVHLYIDRSNDRLVGFATVRQDGYILFLAVNPEYRGQGFGKRLVASVAKEHATVTCHARTTNSGALGFYRNVGFEVQRRIDSYYEDGGGAYYLQLGEQERLRDRLASLLRR
jgi:ribosomal protein S18 acetylase RimI-like enzyme